jgi:hypothetical protein
MESGISNISITQAAHEDQDVKINCQIPGAHIKIEVNTIIRGKCLPIRTLQVIETVEKEFNKSAIINVVSHAELFGGKICAALDRQHPRDLFDVKLLFEHEGITEKIKQGFLIALISHNRPINEVINPVFTDQYDAFNNQFSGMAAIPFSYDDFERTREKLVPEIIASLTENDKEFLIGFKKGEPDWNLLTLKEIAKLPAVQWKLRNIRKLNIKNPEKHALLVKKLEDMLYRKTEK